MRAICARSLALAALLFTRSADAAPSPAPVPPSAPLVIAAILLGAAARGAAVQRTRAACLGGDHREFAPAELRATAFRALVVDRLARHYFEKSPDALGVGVWPLLGTRGHRLGDVRWVDVDSPEVARLRRHLLPERPGWAQLASCCSSTWLDAVCGRNRRLVLVLDESVLPLSPGALMRFLDDVSRRVASGSELVLAFDRQASLTAEGSGRSAALQLRLRERDGGSASRATRGCASSMRGATRMSSG